MMRRACLLTLPFLLLTAACGSSSPTGPSAPGSSGGATITGSFVSAVSGSTARVGRTAAVNATSGEGLSVSVVGTGLSALVRGGRFSLSGVPAGPLALKFQGDGIDDDLGLDPVESTEDIELEVGLDGGTITLESERRSVAGQLQLEGRVESLPPTTADGSLVVAGQLVTTTPETRFFLRGSPATFADLLIGVRVHVKGQPGATSLVASRVDIQNTNTDVPVNVNGVIETFTGDVTAFELTISGRVIKGDLNTEFFDGTGFADVVVGAAAVVKGLQQDGFIYARRLHIEGDEDNSDEAASIHGVVLSVGGAPGLPTLDVEGTTVITDLNTVLRRRGNTQPLDGLVVGMTLHVVGARQPDLSILARMIQVKDDASGGAFQTTGSIGGVKGTCPSLTFKVNGYDVTTSGLTTFSPECSGFKSGTKALVEGVVQPDGSVMATAVAKQ